MDKRMRVNFRTALVCTLGLLTAASFAAAVNARGIRVDDTITCASVAISPGGPFVILSGTGSTTNSVRSGFNFPVLICADSVAGDTNITPLPYQPKNSRVYTWVDLSLAGIAASSLTGPATDPNTPPLSSFQGLNVAIIAQLEVLKLKGSYLGNYEIILNYQDFPEVACDNVYISVPPTLKWHNKSYAFAGGGGVTSPCDSLAVNDFLFDSNGVLLGYNSSSDPSQFVLTPGLPPGWKVQ
jgi:hypothetical protein